MIKNPRKIIFMIFSLALVAFASAPREAHAVGELRDMFRGARATAMGGAFVAVADDEEAIFMNPAGMAGTKKTQIQFANVDIEGSTDIYTNLQKDANAFKKISIDSVNVLMGQNIYGHAQITPSFLTHNFGMAALVDDQIALRARNQALPQIELGYQFTNGFQFAYGQSVLGKKQTLNDLRLGIGGKIMWRRGGYDVLSVPQLLNLNQNTLHDIAGSYGQGYGVDLGMQYIRTLNRFSTLQFGLAETDIGDTSFGSEADPQKNSLALGTAYIAKLGLFRGTVALDFRHLTEDTDWKKKSHVGFELAGPMLAIYGGLNQMYLTYGVSVDFWLMKFSVVSYAEETDSLVFQDPERRYLVHMSFKF
jgi:hypothetical protein